MLTYRPALADLPLRTTPRLASWDAVGSRSQQRLSEYLAEATNLLVPSMETLPDPVAFRLEVGLPREVDLLREHDLDNYLFPVVVHLMRATGRQFVSVSATKRHGASSAIGVSAAVVDPSPAPQQAARLRTTASAETVDYREQVSSGLGSVLVLSPGPIAMDITFGTGLSRSWPNLWKPTIDALGGLVGSTDPRPWHPDDGRITQLGLHHDPQAALRHDVQLAVRARSAVP